MKPQLWSLRSHRTFVLSSCCVAIFSDVFIYGVLPTTLPYDLRDRMGISHDRVQVWAAVIPALYCASMVICSPIAGFLSDICARRQPLFLGAVLFQLVGASLVIAAPSLSYYIAGVAVAGCSSAFVWSTSLALVLESTDEHRVASSMSYVGVSISSAALFGPMLGGILYHAKGHVAVWSMCFAWIALDLTLRLMMIEPRAVARTVGPADSESMQLSVLESQYPIKDALATGEVVAPPDRAQNREKRSKWRPNIFELFMSPRFCFAVVATIFLGTIITSFDGALPLYVEDLFGFSALETGLLFLALAGPAFLQPLIGRLVDRHGGRVIGTTAFMIGCPAFVCLRFVDTNSTNAKILLVFLLAIIGASISATIPVYMAEVSCVVLDKRSAQDSLSNFAQAFSLWSAAYNIGCTLGPLLGGWVQQRAGWKTETWVVGLMSGVSGILAVLFTGPDKHRQ